MITHLIRRESTHAADLVAEIVKGDSLIDVRDHFLAIVGRLHDNLIGVRRRIHTVVHDLGGHLPPLPGTGSGLCTAAAPIVCPVAHKMQRERIAVVSESQSNRSVNDDVAHQNTICGNNNPYN